MAAHLRSIEHQCYECKSRQATCQLYTTDNDALGYYCDKCGEQAMRRLWDASDRQAPVGWPRPSDRTRAP